MAWEAVIGLEVHVQLSTETKLFCRCPNRFGAPPNSLVCPVCLGYPGTLPVLNRRAVDLALRLAVALDCRISHSSTFARKHYFYPDLPKGYQITQWRHPLALGGRLPLVARDGEVELERLHLEEDAGKSLHGAGGPAGGGRSLLDFNRSGVPLVEIVARPRLRTPEEAHDVLDSLCQLLRATGVSRARLEEGSVRCDANVSLRERSGDARGERVEIKNLNSLRFTSRALAWEIQRQTALLEAGERVFPETRRFDAASGRTVPLRDKEAVGDYRYLEEPDLPPVLVDATRIRAARAALPELPWERRERLSEEYGLSPQLAGFLAGDAELADYFERGVTATPGVSRLLAEWLRNVLVGELRRRRQALAEAPSPECFAELVGLVAEGRLTRSAARGLLAHLWQGEETPRRAMERLGLGQVSDAARIREWVEEVLAANPDQVEAYRAGKVRLEHYFVGRVVERSAGRADPSVVREEVRRLLGGAPVASEASES